VSIRGIKKTGRFHGARSSLTAADRVSPVFWAPPKDTLQKALMSPGHGPTRCASAGYPSDVNAPLPSPRKIQR